MRNIFTLTLFILLVGASGALFAQGNCNQLSIPIPGGQASPNTNDCFIVETGVQDGRLFRDASPSLCINKLYPGIFGVGTSYNYSTFLFENTGNSSVCIVINFNPDTFDTPCTTNAHAMAYQEAGGQGIAPYDPENQGVNFLGDVGSSVAQPFEVTVEPGYFMIVFSNNSAATECNFEFSIFDSTGVIRVPGECKTAFTTVNNIGSATGGASNTLCDTTGQLIINSNGSGNHQADKMVFANEFLCGDGSITVKIDSIKNGGWGGIAFRGDSLSASGKKVSLKTQLNNMVIREVRSISGGPVQTQQILRPNVKWLRITRKGNLFTGFTSATGSNWQLAFTTNVVLPECVRAGVFAEGTSTSNNTIAYFSNGSIIMDFIPVKPVPAHFPTVVTEQTEHELHIYPNPAVEVVNIKMPAIELDNSTLIILNQLGQQVHSVQSSGLVDGILNLNVSNWVSGQYFVHVRSNAAADDSKTVINGGKFIVTK